MSQKQISETIMKEVKLREKYTSDFNRCLEVIICPACGADLIETVISEKPLRCDFKCTICSFTYTD
jgi:hypothetical protein